MSKVKILVPLRAIRLKCLDCCGGSINEVKNCSIEDCSLFVYRFGKRPEGKKRIMTEEQKIVVVERLRKAREAKKSI